MSRNQRIKEVLRAKKISQQALADKLGVKQSSIGRALGRRKDIDSLKFLTVVSELTGMSLSYIIKDEKVTLEDGPEAYQVKANTDKNSPEIELLLDNQRLLIEMNELLKKRIIDLEEALAKKESEKIKKH